MGPGLQNKEGEKPKNVRKTIKTLLSYIKPYRTAIIISFIFAIFSCFATIYSPNVLGNATDKLISGISSKTIYNNIIDSKNGFDKLFSSIKSVDTNLTLGDAINKKVVDSDVVDGFDSDFKNILLQMPVATLQQLGLTYKADTIGDYLNFMEKLTGSDDIESQIPETYKDDIMATSLKTEPGIDVESIKNILEVVLLVVFASAAFGYIEGFILSKVSQKMAYELRKEIIQKINKLPLKYYDKANNGEILSYITNDVDTVSNTLTQTLSQLISSIATIVGILIMMIRINIIMTLVSLLIIPITLILISVIVKKSQFYYKTYQNYLGHINGHIEEMYSGHIVVKVFNKEEEVIEKLDNLNNTLYKSSWKSQFLSGLMMPIADILSKISYVIICVIGGYLSIKGRITIGNVQSFITYSQSFTRPLSSVANLIGLLQQTFAASERIFNFLDEDEERDLITNSFGEKLNGHIIFDHVNFGYDENKIIINDFSFEVKPGEKIAIVGPTGAGKTTIVKLLMNFYDLNSGHIYIDDIDINDLSKNELRDNIGMVLQDTWLFEGTLKDNIAYSVDNASDEEIKAAANAASANHFITTLPNGYDFMLNEEVNNISEGEKQLITIARTILKNPKILILDEATSSVDTRTEVLIQKAMNKLMENKTSFIIAHRLSTIVGADKILVINNGDIVEVGSHKELLAQKGFYYDLYNSQFEE